MTLSTDDCNDIRNACQHLALCWDLLRAVKDRHDNEPPVTVPQIEALAENLSRLPDGSVLTYKQIRYELQDLQGDG